MNISELLRCQSQSNQLIPFSTRFTRARRYGARSLFRSRRRVRSQKILIDYMKGIL